MLTSPLIQVTVLDIHRWEKKKIYQYMPTVCSSSATRAAKIVFLRRILFTRARHRNPPSSTLKLSDTLFLLLKGPQTSSSVREALSLVLELCFHWRAFGCNQTAGESDYNLIPSHV